MTVGLVTFMKRVWWRFASRIARCMRNILCADFEQIAIYKKLSKILIFSCNYHNKTCESHQSKVNFDRLVQAGLMGRAKDPSPQNKKKMNSLRRVTFFRILLDFQGRASFFDYISVFILHFHDTDLVFLILLTHCVLPRALHQIPASFIFYFQYLITIIFSFAFKKE